MKRSRTMEVSRYAIWMGIIVFLVLVSGCGNKIKRLNDRLDAVDNRLNVLSEDLKTVDADSENRSADHEDAIRQLEDSLTSKLDEEIMAYDAAGKKRSAGHEAAIRQLEDTLTSRFTEDITAYEAESKKRSAGHETAIRQLEGTLSIQMASQRQSLEQNKATLSKSLDAIKAELENVNERDTKTQLALAATASQKDLTRLIKDVSERYANTQRVLGQLTVSSANAGQISTDIRTAMQRLIEAHEFFVKGRAELVAALEAEMTKGKPKGLESVYLGILYEQRQAQKRMLKEMQNLLSKAAGDMQATSPQAAPANRQ